jgi:photosystem II stability/assembly factor-like uncharacterized protein
LQALTTAAAVVLIAGIAFAVHAARQTARTEPRTAISGPTSLTGPVALVQIRMITPLIGWANAVEFIGADSSADIPLIVRTTDGGTHWQNVTPRGWRPASAEFLDGNKGWALSFVAPRELSILRTRDGGLHWQETLVHDQKVLRDQSNGGAQLTFVDAEHGWFFVSYGNRGGNEAGALYQTVDGGSHWTIVSLTDAATENAGGIPLSGFKVGFTFADRNTGWLTVTVQGLQAPKPLLYVTHDAGKSWSAVKYPDVPGTRLTGGHGISRPRFFSPMAGEFEVFADHSIIYMTGDGGATWQPSVGPPTCCNFFFLDARKGWTITPDGKALFRTTDGGQHWRRSDPAFPPEGHVLQLDFVTSENGYALLSCCIKVLESSDRTGWHKLMKTIDGGATWAEVPFKVS